MLVFTRVEFRGWRADNPISVLVFLVVLRAGLGLLYVP